MKATGIVRRFDDLGRIVIPKEIRRQLFGTKYTDGEPMEIFMDKDDIILRKYEENKSDDVCEWEKDEHSENDNPAEWIICPHKPKRIFSKDIKYCPYCGKKIKVVDQMDEEDFCYCHNDDTDEYHDCLDYMECEECPYYYADLDQESD